MMTWLSDHVAHVVGGGALGGGNGLVVFRDAIGKAWGEWIKDRAEARATRTQAAGSSDRLANALITSFREDIAAQRLNDATLREILGRIVSAVERLSERQDQFNVKQDSLDGRLDRWERSRNIN